jgi:hypothetical protein
MKLYTVVVHNLQMCMREYPFEFWTATIFLHAHLQVVYYNCVQSHKTPISRLGGVTLTRYTTPLFVKVKVEYSCSTQPADVHEGILLLSKI